MLKYERPKFFGASIVSDGVYFRLWAPNQERVALLLDDAGPVQMEATKDGWHEILSPAAEVGSKYRFLLDGGLQVPDPASRFQPADVHGPSEVVDPHGYDWKLVDWAGRPWEECVIYELHIGAFTPEGTFRSAIERLDYLAELGITAIEIMPVADFPGNRNWGYDGVLLFAPDSSYGRPEDLKAFIDAAHARRIMVFLDVVYNHFGPDGNYLPSYSPIFTDRHKTPWGDAVNYDADRSEMVREFVIQNAIYWITEFRFDGLRLDAVHAIKDDSDTHIVDELATRVRNAAKGRHIHLLLENEENEVGPLEPSTGNAPYTAQWNDDVHHALHTAITGERSGYYADYAGDTEKLGRSLAEGFAFQGETMIFRSSARGEPSAHLPPTAFVSFIQNHDQVGNRAFGERLNSLASAEALRAVVATYLLLPQIPMLFMGEEFCSSQPFPFFAHFQPELAEEVRNGRRLEFAKFPEFQDPHKREAIPDPTSDETFQSAKLNWKEAMDGQRGAEWLAMYRDLLAIRRREIVPRLKNIGGYAGHFEILAENAVLVHWKMGDGSKLHLAANLSSRPLFEVKTPGRRLWSVGSDVAGTLDPWGINWSIEGEGP